MDDCRRGLPVCRASIDVPIYTTLAANIVCYIINDSGAKVFFLQNKETFERITEIFPECKTLEKLIFFNAEGVEAENAMSLAELEKLGAKLKAEKPDLIKRITAKRSNLTTWRR